MIQALRPYGRLGMTRRELAKRMGIKKKQKDRFFQALDSLIRQNRIVERNGRLYPMEELKLVPGEVVKVSGTFGFARPDGRDADVFIPGKLLGGAMPGDRVLLRLSKGRKGDLEEGEVFQIVEEVNRPFSGVLQLEGGVYAVLPDRVARFPIPVIRGGLGDARPGDKVLAELASRGERHSEHTVRIVESFGSALSAASCSLSVLAGLDIPTVFPDDALAEAHRKAEDGIHPREVEARLDLRRELIFTIDGADSKDLDDAISLTRMESGWELGVHIADVSHYVAAGSALDQEAFRRGCSVYYADSVIPMLPEDLSNGICSLNPGEDRLAFSALIRLDGAGRMTGYRFVKSVIRSRVKGVYEELNALLEEPEKHPGLRGKYAEIWDQLLEMVELAKLLMANRTAEGKMELASVESKITLNDRGEPIEISPRERGFCERMIEEFMLQANEAAATLAGEKHLPFVYRVHDQPDPERLEQFYQVLNRLGISYRQPGKENLSQGLADILGQVEGTSYAGVVSSLILRSMAKAKYAAENTGHFGLSMTYYAHFTSPIRRYPDLTIHRILSAWLSGGKLENLIRRYTPFAASSADRSSQRELAAQQAERDCQDCYKASYMARFIGQEFEGVVTGCTPHGAYVQLPNTCEGLVRLADFPPGDWGFDGQIAFLNATGRDRIQLGDPVTVRVLSASVSSGQVDFQLTEIKS